MASTHPASTHPEHELVGITTEQATANLVPALILGVGWYRAVDSAKAEKDAWGVGLARLLEARLGPDRHARVSLGEASTIEAIMAVVRDAIAQSPERPRAWCLGGGTKPHQIAIWRLFVERFNAGHTADLAVYAEPSKRETFLIGLRRDDTGQLHLVETSLPTGVSLEVSEVLMAFGREGVRPQGRSLPPLPVVTPETEAEITRFRSDAVYRQRWFGLSVSGPGAYLASQQGTLQELLEALRTDLPRKTLLAQMVSAIGAERLRIRPLKDPEYLGHWPPRRPSDGGPWWSFPLSDYKGPAENLAQRCLSAVLSTKNVANALAWTQPPAIDNPFTKGERFAQYFEALLAHRVAMLRRPELHPDGRVNVSVRRVGAVRDEQEHDVLLSTNLGTLLSLDAKTFDAELKDMNSRLLKTKAASGSFGRFVLVIPYFVDDFAGGWVPAVLRDLPFFCNEHGISFVVIGPTDDTFWVRRDAASGRVEQTQQSADAVCCQSLEDFLRARP